MIGPDFARHVPLQAVHNFRDLGGYVGLDGKRLRSGILYRADGLQRLTPADVEVVAGLGIRTVVDLRTDDELASVGTFPRDRLAVQFHHVPILDVTWKAMEMPVFDRAVDFLHYAYVDMLETSRERFRDAFVTVVEAADEPVVFHCMAGKDRTGLLSMLLLGSLGVSNHDIAEDYGLTTAAIRRFRDWVAEHHPDRLHFFDDDASHHMSSDPEAMRRLLSDIDVEHGGVVGLVSSMGVDTDVVTLLRRRMFDSEEWTSDVEVAT